MPTVSEFFGIAITMYYREHGVPHFHARYAEYSASIAIDSLEVLEGTLPSRALRLVREWAEMYQLHLYDNWERCKLKLPLKRIDPLS